MCQPFEQKGYIKVKLMKTMIRIRFGYDLLNIFLLDMNFDKSTVELHFLFISSMLAKFQKDQKSIAMLSIKCLNFKFL